MPTLPPLTGTVNLPAGTYTHSGDVNIPAGSVITGAPGTIVSVSGGFVRAAGNNITIRNIAFDFNGSHGVRRDGDLIGFVIDNCIIRRARVGVESNRGNGLTVRNTLIEHATSFSTWLSDQQNLLLENNEVTECPYGFKVFSGNATLAKSWVARRNWIHDCKNDFMAFEWQGVCDGWTLEQNLIERIRFGSAMSDNDHSLLMSVPMDRGVNGIVRSNAILGQKPRANGWPGLWENGHPCLIEAGGDNTLIEHNALIGGGTAIAVTDKLGSCSITIRNNLVRDVWNLFTKDSSAQILTFQGANDASALIPMSVDQIRAVAGRKGTGTTPPPEPPPPPPADDDAELIELRAKVAALAAANVELQRKVDGRDEALTEIEAKAKSARA